MMGRRLRSLLRDQRGLTLVELLIAILLAGIVTAGITVTMGHLLTGSTRTSNHMTAVRQVQSAGYWVSRDVLQTPTRNVNYTGDDFLSLVWDDSQGARNTVIYTIQDGRLQRSHEVGDAGATVTYVAHYIDPDTRFGPSETGSGFEFEVTATVGAGSVYEGTETRVYRIDPRPDG